MGAKSLKRMQRACKECQKLRKRAYGLERVPRALKGTLGLRRVPHCQGLIKGAKGLERVAAA